MKGGPFNKASGAATRHKSVGVSLFRPDSGPAVMPATNDTRAIARASAFPGALFQAAIDPDRVWDSLTAVTLDPTHLEARGLSARPALAQFDMLRTRLVQAMGDKGWTRLAVTSATHGCGKSFVAANLALSMARLTRGRTVLLDLELRNPGLAGLLGVGPVGALGDFLTGAQPLEGHFLRAGRNLALGLNDVPVASPAELLQDPDTTAALGAMIDQLDPDFAIYDLPPALAGDDVLAMLPQVDAVLVVADGTSSTAEDIRAVKRLLDNRTPLIGVVLNRAQDGADRYRYGKTA